MRLVLPAIVMLSLGLAGTETSAQAVAPPPVVTAPAPKPALQGYPEKMRLLGCVEAAREVYALLGVADRLVATYPPGPHGFPPEAREEA